MSTKVNSAVASIVNDKNADLIKAWASAQGRADLAGVTMADALIASGCNAGMLEKPKADEDRTLFDWAKRCIVASFSGEAQTLLSADIDSLDGPRGRSLEAKRLGKQTERRLYWQRQINTRLDDMRRILKRREEKADKSPKPASTLEAKLAEDLDKWLKRLGDAESVEFDLLKMQGFLKNARALIK